MRKIKVGLVQQSNTADTKANLYKLAQNIEDVCKRGAQLVVLQELHNSLYFCQMEDTQNFDLAEPIPGPSTGFFGELARQFGIVLVTSLFERRTAGLYHNTAVVFDTDGSVAGTYRKMHIPDDPAYYEKFYFTPGDLGFHPISTSLCKLGVQVCWDQWYPEGARLMALQGAELLIYPTAIGYESSDIPEEQERQREAWTTVQRGHAVANGLPVIAVWDMSRTRPDKPVAYGSGAAVSWPVRRARCWHVPVATRKKTWWWKLIWNARKTCAVGGLSCATAASKSSLRSPAVLLIKHLNNP